ncbi:MAG: ABC transporter permease [Candidatus Cloacimonetes bacterium]|nr:ABC transporter permease [Candidatus Cloacimonadota bacterium]
MNPAERLFIERYISDPKRNLLRFSFLFMILGIVISVGILTAALNLFEGYERALKSVLLDSFAHIRVYGTGAGSLPDSLAEATLNRLNAFPEIKSAVPVLNSSLMAQNGSKARSGLMQAYAKAIGEEAIHAKYVTQGSAQVAAGQVIVGHYLARDLGLALGDTMLVSFPRLDLITPLGLYPNQRPLKVTGIYNSGFYEYDRSLMIGSLADLRALSGLASGFSNIELRLQNTYADDAQNLAAKYDHLLGPYVYAAPVVNTTLLSMVKMQKWLIFIVFSFLVLIAGINVISGVLTQILDKRNEIAVLKALGAAPGTVRNILGSQITLVCLASVILGQLFGFLLSWLIVKQNVYKLKGDVYFIDRLELYVSPFNQALIFVVAALLILLCVRIPLRRIDRMRTIDLLRNT